MSDVDLLSETDALIGALEERTAEDRSHAEEILARFDEVDAQLVKHGFPATSPWWRETFERWYRSGKRQLVGRVGRRGGKSSSLSRLGVVEALFGHHNVPPGDVGCVAVISTDKPEALGRLRTIEEILNALEVPWKPLKAPQLGIELVGKRRVFRVFTATIAGVSGFTGIFVLCDEVAKWKDADTGVNPATEVLHSVRPTMATQLNARMVLSSSPLGRLDAHFDAYEQGETPLQVTAWAPTWVANPTLTEEQTRALEPDESVHDREYGAIPQASAESSLLTEFLVKRATRVMLGDMPRLDGHFYTATMDPATRGHAWTFAITTRGVDDRRRVVATREWRGTPSNPVSSKSVFREILPVLGAYGLKTVFTDQWALDPIAEHASDAGITLIGEPWTSQSKAEAYEELLKIAQPDLLEIPDNEDIKNDLLGIIKRLTRNGFTFDLREYNGRHSDFAPTIAMGVLKSTLKPEVHDDVYAGQYDQKNDFLMGLERDRKRRERNGAYVPPTHRRMR